VENTINRTVNSVLNQSFLNYEYLIIDDGSSDNTISLLNQIKDTRVKVFKKDKIGRAKALNFGLLQARGKYIAIVDADDVFFTEKLRVQFDIINNNKKLKLICSSANIINKNGKQIGFYKSNKNHNQLVNNIFKLDPFPHSSVMYLKQAALKIGGYNEKCEKSIDFNFYLDFLKAGFKFYGIEIPLVSIRYYHESWGRSDNEAVQMQYGILGLIDYYQQFNNDVGILSKEFKNWEESKIVFKKWFVKENITKKILAKRLFSQARNNLKERNIKGFLIFFYAAFMEDKSFFLYKGVNFNYPKDVIKFLKYLKK